MDAKIGDWVVTPRTGKAVEIQALWYNALCNMADLADRFGDISRAEKFAGMAARAQTSFAAKFWNHSANCLYDVVSADGVDESIRPNQIFAASLYHQILSAQQARAMVETVQRELLTPLGLRTLPQRDSRYVPRYVGGPGARDAAYHQGTVWPWLMGPFLEAYLKVNEWSVAARQQASQWLLPFADHLAEAGLGQVSEICDAEPPHAPRGCFAQAWSVGEILRVARMLEDAATEASPRPDRKSKATNSEEPIVVSI
jgi:glycogen debranching enzyme